MRKKIITSYLVLFLLLAGCQIVFAQSRIVKLRLEDVVQKSLSNNLGLKSTEYDYKSQKLTKWQAVSSFLPTMSYMGNGTNNLELQTMALMGQRFTIGTEYNFQHSLELSFPLFTGFSRIANFRMQRNLEKSLKAELDGMEEETALTALKAYFQIMLSQKLINVNQEAVKAAEANLEQVRQFHDVGAASELDLKRAESQYSSTLPALESAKNQLILAQNQLKFILNLSLDDSLVVLDSLNLKQFSSSFTKAPLEQLKATALQNRPELAQTAYQASAIKQQKTIALSQGLPTIALSANVGHMAMTDSYEITQKDYTRSKSVNLVVQWPLFQGGQTALEFQKARYQERQMDIAKQQINYQVLMEVEQSYFTLNENIKNLSSLRASLEQSKEAFRLSNLMYMEGMSTQVEVLDAQLQYTQSNIGYQQGVYDYNTSQLDLLKAIGKMNTILQ